MAELTMISKSLDDRITDILQEIVDSNCGITDTNYGSVIRALVSAIANEQDIQEYNIEYIYNCMDINKAVDGDLDRLVEILRIYRKQATHATGMITFYINEPKKSDIYIYKDTVVTTKQATDGSIIEFKTMKSATLTAGELSVDIPIEALEPGMIHIPKNTVIVMSRTVPGIIGVTNNNEISGGSDEESDEELRQRAKLIGVSHGKGTLSALENAIKACTGVLHAHGIDYARGAGTVDMYVSCDNMPPSSMQQEEIAKAVADTKSAGIDVQVIYPSIEHVNIEATLTHNHANEHELHQLIAKAIIKYFNNLNIGDDFVWVKLIATILSVSETIKDVDVTIPTDNISGELSKVLRAGEIKLDGEVVTI